MPRHPGLGESLTRAGIPFVRVDSLELADLLDAGTNHFTAEPFEVRHDPADPAARWIVTGDVAGLKVGDRLMLITMPVTVSEEWVAT
jgi:hypothetical protein